jgi:serine/threonine-protein kinase RsbT
MSVRTSALTSEELRLASDEDVVRARHLVRQLAQEQGLRLIDQTKLVTAVSELARNTVVHGGGGSMSAGVAVEGARTGVWVEFADDGPGISDVDEALGAGFTTGDGLGLGLGGAKRLVHEFDVRSAPGSGTHIRVVTWR